MQPELGTPVVDEVELGVVTSSNELPLPLCISVPVMKESLNLERGSPLILFQVLMFLAKNLDGEIMFCLPAVLVLLDERQVAGHHRGGAVRHEGKALLLARCVEVVKKDAPDASAHSPVGKDGYVVRVGSFDLRRILLELTCVDS